MNIDCCYWLCRASCQLCGSNPGPVWIGQHIYSGVLWGVWSFWWRSFDARTCDNFHWWWEWTGYSNFTSLIIIIEWICLICLSWLSPIGRSLHPSKIFRWGGGGGWIASKWDTENYLANAHFCQLHLLFWLCKNKETKKTTTVVLIVGIYIETEFQGFCCLYNVI